MCCAHHGGIYVHAPFCRRKCLYCNFFSFVPQKGQIRAYLQTLRLQMRQLAELEELRALRWESIFFGGGTPSILPLEALTLLLAECQQLFACSEQEREITLEVNPGALPAGALAQLRRAGFNRLSIGVQSFQDEALRRLGRIHGRAEAVSAIIAAKRAGFDNLNLDLIYALPGQSLSDWRDTLRQALEAAPTHLSLYELSIEEDTPYAQLQQQGRLHPPAEELVLEMMALTENTLAATSFRRYEISNYALPGRECRHNLQYWRNGAYLGLGPGAVSAFGGARRSACRNLARYCDRIHAGLDPWDEIERLDREAAFRETVVMGLRLVAGVSRSSLRARFGLDPCAYYGHILTPFLDAGLLTVEDDRFFLRASGLRLANQVMAALV